MSPEYRARIEAGRPRLLAIAKETYGLDLQQGPFGIDSRPALIGAKYAEAQGVGLAYHDAILQAFWLAGTDIGDRSVLAALAAEVGLAEPEFLAALEDPAYDQQVQTDVDMARQYGLNGVPAIVFDMRYLISGAQPYPVLAEAVEQVLAETNGDDDTDTM